MIKTEANLNLVHPGLRFRATSLLKGLHYPPTHPLTNPEWGVICRAWGRSSREAKARWGSPLHAKAIELTAAVQSLGQALLSATEHKGLLAARNSC